MNEMARASKTPANAHAHRHLPNRVRDHVQRQVQLQVQEHEDGPGNATTMQAKTHRQQQNYRHQTRSSHNRTQIENGEDVHDIIDDDDDDNDIQAYPPSAQSNNNNICVHHVGSVRNYKTEPETQSHGHDDFGGSGNSISHNSDRSNCTTGMSIQMISAAAVDEPMPKVQHLSLATGLIATYLIEIGIQIFLTFRCCPSLVSLFTTSSPTSGQSDYAWTWFLFISLSTILSSVLVTTVSIIWVCLGLDFAGRLCGRLLCYVMHFLHLGLLWRYLKLAFAYDAADIQEFIALRNFQLFIQSLPLTTLHLAWCITFQENWSGATPWLILIESGSVIIAVIISSHIKQASQESSAHSSSYQSHHHHLQQHQHPKKKKQVDNCANATGVQKLTAIPNKLMFLARHMKTTLSLTVRAVLIFIRLILLALLIAQLPAWVLLVLLASHFFIVFSWAGLNLRLRIHRKAMSHIDCCDDEAVRVRAQDKLELESENRFCGLEFDLVRKVIEFCYILFWDVSFFISHSTITRISPNLNLGSDSKSNIKSMTEPTPATMTDMNLSLWAFPICLALLENCILLGYVWFQRAFLPQNQNTQFGLLLLIMALILGLCVVYFVVVNFLYGKCTISKLCDVSRRTPTNHVTTVPAFNPTATANDHRHHHSSGAESQTSDVITPDQEQYQDQSVGSGNKTVKNGSEFDGGRSSKTITVNETKTRTHNGDYGRNKIISQNNEKLKLERDRNHISLSEQDQHDNDNDSCEAKCRSRSCSRSRTLEGSTSKNCLKTTTNNYIDIRSQSQAQSQSHVVMTAVAGASSTVGRRKLKKAKAKAHTHARGCHTDDDYGSSSRGRGREKISKNLTSKDLSHYIRTSRYPSNVSPPEEATSYPSLLSTSASASACALNIDPTPMSWVPETDTCCNDSNGSSSNSRNTNTLLTEIGTTGSGEKSISLLEEQEQYDHDDDSTGDEEHVFYYPKQYSPLVAPDPDHRTSPSPVTTVTVTPSRTRKLHARDAHSTNHNYKHHRPASASAAPGPPQCRSTSASNNNANNARYMRKSEGGKLTPVSNVSCVTMALPFQSGSLQRMRARTSTPVEIKKAARVIMNTSCSPNKNHSSNGAGGGNNHVHRKAICSTVSESPCVAAAAAVAGDQLSNSNKLGLVGEKRTSDGGRCTSTKPSATRHAVASTNTKRSRIDHQAHMKPVSISRRGIIIDPPNDYDKLMEDSYGILICEGEENETHNTTAASTGNCIDIDGVNSCRNEKLQFHQPPTSGSSRPQPQQYKSTSSQHYQHQQQQQHLMPSIFHVNKKLRVLCAKCLQNHDPLLTNCLLEEDEPGHQHQERLNSNSGRLHYNYNNNELCLTNINNNNARPGSGLHLRRLHTPCAPSETTEYPSGTEMTWTLHDDADEDHDDDDQLSGGGDDVSSSHLSNATYTTWPKSSYHPSQVQRQCQRQQQQKMSMWNTSTTTTTTMLPPSMNNGSSRFPKEFTSREYVRTWLLSSGQTVKPKQNQYYHACENTNANHNCRECRPSKSNGYHTLNGSNLKRSQNVQIGPKPKYSGTRQSPPTVPSQPKLNHNQGHTPALAKSEDSYYETLSMKPSASVPPCLNKNQLMLSESERRHKNKRPGHSLSPATAASIPVREINEPDSNINELSFNQRKRVTVTPQSAHALYTTQEVQVDVEAIPEEFGVDVGVGGGKDMEIIV